MLHKVKTLKEYKLNGIDGEIGKVHDLYFDDQFWTIRYLVANTGSWLTDNIVLISPYALATAIKAEKHIDISLTKKQIENSPPLESDKPVSQQFERDYYAYYGWPAYYTGSFMWGIYPQIRREEEITQEANLSAPTWDPHLRSANEVSDYYVHANDGDIGHVVDIIIDDETWAIRYLIIETSNWWSGKKVMVSPRWIDRVIWSKSKVYINLSQEAIKQSPEYSEEALLTRDYETALHRHYNRQGYWQEELVAKEHSL
ncbi:PRC-barrel domain-containing protein [Haliscomenobacter sp.]|uniref:PRC-barrel domain-containing protein n=1 Tax=Haliscomenobacter sp. TaxID=2717303 RepID=UPI00359464B8